MIEFDSKTIGEYVLNTVYLIPLAMAISAYAIGTVVELFRQKGKKISLETSLLNTNGE